MIELQNVTKSFGDRIAVSHVTMSVGKGVVLGLLGPNGAGKTTVMNMITGYLPPTDGRILVGGRDMFEQPEEVKKKIGYLPEHPPLYLDLTVEEYLRFAGRLRGMESDILGKRIPDVAGICGIADVLGRLNGNLSKGYRQRVGLAQALIHDPEVLVLDEPTSGLDPQQIIEIRELIKDLGRERTVIISSHILKEVTSLCGKLAILNYGELVAFDSLENLSNVIGAGQTITIRVERPDQLDIEGLGAIDHIRNVNKIGDNSFEIEVESGFDMRDNISVFIVESGAGLIGMNTGSMGLEEIFIKLISNE